METRCYVFRAELFFCYISSYKYSPITIFNIENHLPTIVSFKLLLVNNTWWVKWIAIFHEFPGKIKSPLYNLIFLSQVTRLIQHVQSAADINHYFCFDPMFAWQNAVQVI